MYEIIKYYAEDGTEFEDEDECYEYEQDLACRSYDDKILILDKDFDKIENYIVNFGEACLIYIRTDEAGKWLKNELDNYGWCLGSSLPECKGIWYWEERRDAWVSLEDIKEFVSDIEKYTPNWKD